MKFFGNKASRALNEVRAGRSIRKFLLDLDMDVAPSTLWRWLRAESKPETKHRVSLYRKYGIPIEDWDDRAIPKEIQ